MAVSRLFRCEGRQEQPTAHKFSIFRLSPEFHQTPPRRTPTPSASARLFFESDFLKPAKNTTKRGCFYLGSPPRNPQFF